MRAMLVKTFFLLACIQSGLGYTQDEINNAWQKMLKRETLFKPLDNQLGCWPSNVIPYTILPGFSYVQIKHILSHINQIHNRTCVRWVSKSKVRDFRKHVEFFHNETSPNDCKIVESGISSSRQGITVRIFLGDNCFPTESVIHEMLHAMGFTHEHSRLDRDCYVKVNEHFTHLINFKVIYDDSFEKWPYDKRSVLHYSRQPGGSKLFSTFYMIKDKNEPFGGLIWKLRMGDSHGFWGRIGTKTGKLTYLDAYKINYRFCGAPDFCETQPKVCQDIDEEERLVGCKQLYSDVASGQVVPNDTK